MSPFFFASTIRTTIQHLKQKRESKGYGTIIGSSEQNKNRLTFVIFADDTTLIARSNHTLRCMLRDAIDELQKIVLNLNADKCKVQCSKQSSQRNASLKIQNLEFPIASPDEGFKMLGTIFTFNGNTHAEFQVRLDAGWSKFFSLKRLFNATISKTVLWCAESWKLTVEEKTRLRAMQRSMLRKMVCPNRRPDEDYT